jgi:Uma2 family endonuclease
MSGAAENLMTVDEFLAWERQQPERYEFAGGVAVMMTSGSLDHSTIASNLRTTLREKLRGTPCLPFRGDAKVIANGNVRYPDLTVTCSPVAGQDDIVPDPLLVFEVASPTTARADRGRKKFDYFATPSIRQYVIIEQDERLIDLYTRTDDAVLVLSSIGVEVGLDAIYEDTELAATGLQADEEPARAG